MHGGIMSSDGVVTSVGMKRLVQMIREQYSTVKKPAVDVKEYLWGDYVKVYHELSESSTKDSRVLIGYSGGGAKATWVANGNLRNDGTFSLKPRIDLMVTYDPSPQWSMMDVGKNVVKGINYYNTMPLMFGIGGGRFKGPNVKEVQIAMQHLAVQFSSRLHEQTLAYIKELAK